jgi:hypothetical protein
MDTRNGLIANTSPRRRRRRSPVRQGLNTRIATPSVTETPLRRLRVSAHGDITGRQRDDVRDSDHGRRRRERTHA